MVRAYAVAAVLVLPLLAVSAWSGFRVAPSDSVLAAIAPSEQPLSVRSPGGGYAMLLALGWFALAYWCRDVRWWEPLLVVAGGLAALLRTGNEWIDAICLVAPLGRQLGGIHLNRVVLGGLAVVGLAVAVTTLVATRPPALPNAAIEAARAAEGDGTVFADWRWAGDLQRGMGQQGRVLAAGGLASESADFWLDYVRVVQDFDQWPIELRQRNVDLLVLNTEQSGIVDQVRSSPDWHVVYDSGNALVARRAGS